MTAGGSGETPVRIDWKRGDVYRDLYEVRSFLGAGGTTEVYRVHHRGWRVDFAAKVPSKPLVAMPERLQGFLREAEAWAWLERHPHTVTCFQVDAIGGIPVVFVEYVEGGTLVQWINSGRLYEGGPGEALKRMFDIAIQMVRGLQHLHHHGLIHRNVKPGNVLMALDGSVMVDLSLAGKGALTPSYAAPEQLARAPVTRSTDIWSWAASVLEMFAGERTWLDGSATPDALETLVEFGPIDAAIPRMPAAMVGLLRSCLQQSAERRPQDISTVVGAPVAARKSMPTPADKPTSPSPRRSEQAAATRPAELPQYPPTPPTFPAHAPGAPPAPAAYKPPSPPPHAPRTGVSPRVAPSARPPASPPAPALPLPKVRRGDPPASVDDPLIDMMPKVMRAGPLLFSLMMMGWDRKKAQVVTHAHLVLDEAVGMMAVLIMIRTGEEKESQGHGQAQATHRVPPRDLRALPFGWHRHDLRRRCPPRSVRGAEGRPLRAMNPCIPVSLDPNARRQATDAAREGRG